MQSGDDEVILVDELTNLALDRPPSPLKCTETDGCQPPDSKEETLIDEDEDAKTSRELEKPEKSNVDEKVQYGKAISRAAASRKSHMRNRKRSCLKAPKDYINNDVTEKTTRVKFPEGDSIITEKIDAEDPWKNVREISIGQLVSEYKLACEKLRIKPNEKIRKQIQEIRATACRVEGLVLTGIKLDERMCESLESVFRKVQFEFIDLENCNLEEEGATSLFEMIEFYQSAYRLNISCNQRMSPRGWQAACRMLKRTPCLYHLDARRTFLTDQTMPIFGRCLKVNMNLRVLQLEDSYLTGRPFLLLMTAMKYNKTLEELYVGHNDLTHSDANAMCAMLSCNTTLQLLDIRNNSIKDIGLSHIGHGLMGQNDCGMGGLESLVVWNNGITAEGLGNFSEALSKTVSLRSLNIGQNKFSDLGMQRLKPGLMRNKSLQKLGLLNTKLGNEGAVALAEVLADSSSLTRIDLRGNRINVAGLMAVSLALKVNQTLTRLDLDKDLKKEQGLESVQQSVLADIYNYCYRNKQSLREGSRRQLSLSEESSCSSTYSEEDFFNVEEISSDMSPDGGEVEEPEVKMGSLELSLESSCLVSSIPVPLNDKVETEDAPLVTLPLSITGRSRFTITRIIETVGHGISASANVANKLVSNVGIDSIAKSAARKLSRGEKDMIPVVAHDKEMVSVCNENYKTKNMDDNNGLSENSIPDDYLPLNNTNDCCNHDDYENDSLNESINGGPPSVLMQLSAQSTFDAEVEMPVARIASAEIAVLD